ncbi:MAG: hypothetical protein GY854_33585 [Deltaproteobacteria bacterium]|nr:hypothetical protein [Deltaproteobacteria bacterium]
MYRLFIGLAAALLVLAGFETEVFADDLPEDVAVPIIVVDMGLAVGPAAVDEVVEAIASPTLRGEALARRLSLAEPVDERFGRALTKTFHQAQNLFFSGREKTAEAAFKKIVGQSRANPFAVSVSKALREIVFKAHVFLAVVARAAADDSVVEGWLRDAALGFPDFKPSTVDFPPWECDEFYLVRSRAGSALGSIKIEAPPNCEMFLSGRNLGKEKEIEGIEFGEHAVNVSCEGRAGPVQSLTVGKEKTIYRPIVISRSRLETSVDDITLVANQGTTPSSIVWDLLAITRAGQWPRSIAVVGVEDGVEVWLIDSDIGGVIRKASSDAEATGTAGGALIAITGEEVKQAAPPRKRPWYKDGLAWTLVGVGLAAAATGLAIAQVGGSPSSKEPLAWALLVGGGGVFITGSVLFFFPKDAPKKSGTGKSEAAYGLMIHGTF